MKRADALRPLSREHLTALLVAKTLREAGDVEQATAAFLLLAGRRAPSLPGRGGGAAFRPGRCMQRTLLHDHVRFDERELFPIVEEALDDESLGCLAAAIEAAELSGRQSAAG
jgi:hypothetical protein